MITGGIQYWDWGNGMSTLCFSKKIINPLLNPILGWEENCHLLFIIRWWRSLCRPTPTAPDVTKITSIPSEISSLTCTPTESPHAFFDFGRHMPTERLSKHNRCSNLSAMTIRERQSTRKAVRHFFFFFKSDPRRCISSRILSLPVHTEHRVSQGQASHLLLSLQPCQPTIPRKSHLWEQISLVGVQSPQPHRMVF